jgi:amino acid transporter
MLLRDIPLVFAMYLGWKFFKKTHIVSLRDIPLREALDEIDRNPEEPLMPPKGWRRLNIFWA